MIRSSQILLTFMVLFSAVSGAAQTKPPAPANTDRPKSGSITGKVVSEGGQPLPDARVQVELVGSQGRFQFAMTDRAGAFKVDGLDQGSYFVVASLPSYTLKPREPAASPAPQYHVGDSVTLVLIKGGVITGTVTRANGEPVIRVPISARLVRDPTGRKLSGAAVREATTDDRGIYRLYGLPAGTYIVGTDGTNDYSQTGVNAYANDVSTFAPSSNRDAAAEITVRSGEEVSNVDIRYRGERGRTVSGTVAEVINEQGGVTVILSVSGPGGQTWNSYAYQPGNRSFAFDGVADGDYYVTAMSYLRENERALSESKLINVRGADVTGIELIAQPLGQVSGRVLAEETKAAECTEKTPLAFTETSVSAWHKDIEPSKDRPQFVWSMGAPGIPNEQGTFTLRFLAPSQYYFQARPPAKHWFLKSIMYGAPKPADVTHAWTNIKSGDRLRGLTVTFASGAASVSGKLVVAEGQERPEKVFVYLIPVEPERADDLLRFYGAPVMPDGTIALNNLAPGRYWVLSQVVIEETAASPLAKARLPDATRLRAKLRREAEAAKTEIELKPCQQVADFEIQLKN